MSKRMMICPSAEICPLSPHPCPHKGTHKAHDNCADSRGCSLPCIPYRPRKNAKTRKVVKHGWVSNRFTDYLKTLKVATFHTVKRPFCVYRATLTIEVPK